MRYIHGCKPRNPLNMIIQENHAAGRANLIIPHDTFFVKLRGIFTERISMTGLILSSNYKIEEIYNPVHTIYHERGKYFTKE